MKKSKILQLNNAFIQSERKNSASIGRTPTKNRFMGAILILVIFLLCCLPIILLGLTLIFSSRKRNLLNWKKLRRTDQRTEAGSRDGCKIEK